MKDRFKARVDKLEQRVTPKKQRIYRWLEDGEEALAVLDRMVAAGEVTEDQRDCVLFVSWLTP